MFEGVSIEKRWRAILWLIGVAYLMAALYGWQVWALHDQVGVLEGKTARLAEADLEIVNRQVELKLLGDEIGRIQRPGVELADQVAFMAYLDTICQVRGLTLVRLPEEEVEQKEGFGIVKTEFQVEGMFHDILNLIYQLEYTDRVGSVGYVDLERKSVRVEDGRMDVLLGRVRLNRMLNVNSKLKDDV